MIEKRRSSTRSTIITISPITNEDWTAQLLSRARRLVPLRLRGSRRERDLRSAVSEAVRRVTVNAVPDYDGACELFRGLHDQADTGSLRLLTATDITPSLHTPATTEPTTTQTPPVTASTSD